MKTVFVAEVASNHNGDLARCLGFIDTAARLGCDAVKFQLFKIRELFAKKVLAHKEDLKAREAWQLPVAFLPELAAKCRDVGVRFGCTPFYLQAVEELRSYVDYYKVASYELLSEKLLIACARAGKPVVLSTGMATLDEVKRAVATVRAAGCLDVSVLHCVSSYPTPVAQCNLAAIETLRRECGCEVGWSDHSLNDGVIYRAALQWGASMIEFHLDLDGNGAEYKTGHCWLPDQIAPVIATIRTSAAASGTGEKLPGAVECRERDWRADPQDGLRPLMKVRSETWSTPVPSASGQSG